MFTFHRTPTAARPRMPRFVYTLALAARTSLHETRRNADLAQRIAAAMGWQFGGPHDNKPRAQAPSYVVPDSTITDAALARQLRIHSPDDLFGGVVPDPLLASKLFLHGAFDGAAD